MKDIVNSGVGAYRFFLGVIRWRWASLLLALGVLIVLGSQLGNLQKNTQADAFISEEEPALKYRETVERIFNLKDPLVIAVHNEGAEGIYNQGSLELVRWITDNVKSVPNIDPDGITSLATESNIEGDPAGMEVREFLDGPLTQEHISWIRKSIESFPLYQGSLVSEDGSMTLVVAELLDQSQAEQTYNDILDLLESSPSGSKNSIHVAGEGAISGYLSTYIDQDAKRLNPLAAVIITIILIVAFFTPRAAIIPNLVVAGTVVGTLGLMAASGVEFYVITNGLIVCMIGIAVADSVHIFSEYYERLESDRELGQRVAIASALAHMWRPVTLTTLTTAAGFLALYPTNDMPPLQYFGVFGAIAVFAAWLFTLFVTPALLSLLPVKRSRRFKQKSSVMEQTLLVRILSVAATARPKITIFVATLVAALAAVGAAQVKVNEERIENFQKHEPIYIADKTINEVMDGTYYLDVVIEAPAENGIYEPKVLRQIEALQEFLENQPEVYGTTSIVDYIKQMNKAVNNDQSEYYQLPDNGNLVAQLFLLYTASGDPTDFENRIDSKRQTALVRANLKTGSYQTSQLLIPDLERYLNDQFGNEVDANISGRVNVDYHWIAGIAESHLMSVFVSFGAVFVMASLLFRSIAGGVMASLPVGLSILVIYAVMGFKGIWLGVGTSMFAAIAIGLSVDFAIHTLDRLREFLRADHDESIKAGIRSVFHSTGRALWFNLLAVGLGFGVLLTSQVPPLVNFGLLVALAVSIAFVASLVVLPAIAIVVKPRFLFHQDQSFWKVAAVLVCLIAGTVVTTNALADSSATTAQQVVERMNTREEGESVQRDMVLTLTDRNGNSRVEKTKAFRRYFGDTKKTVIFYTDPANVAGTAFLTWDYADQAKDDDQWLYLPALRKVRRISASDRGDYFLGTDFTYEEIKKESKIAAEDYDFELLGEETIDGHHTWAVRATPNSKAAREALGYSKVVLRIDSNVWIPRFTEYWDVAGNFLKTVHSRQIENIDGIWSVIEITAENHKTGHQTHLEFRNTDYDAAIPERLFEKTSLKRGY